MSKATQLMRLRAKSDDWDDLTELVEALSEYAVGNQATIYTVVQAIAEGEETEMSVPVDMAEEFIAHMSEFKIETIPVKR